MKILFHIILLCFSFSALADIETCLKDAKTFANHFHAIAPSIECADLIKLHPDKIEVSQNGYSLYGLEHMFYVEKDGIKELMAGDQTELEDIRKMSVNTLKNKIIVIQDDSVSTFRLGFVGNVTPERVYKDEFVSSVSSAKLLDEENAIALFSSNSLKIIDANSDSRFEVEALKPRVLHSINSETSGLQKPIDAVLLKANSKLAVLDEEKILVFNTSEFSPQAPVKIINVTQGIGLKLNTNRLILIKSTGEEVEINLIN